MSKACSSDCHTFYMVYKKQDEKFINKFFIREKDAINYCYNCYGDYYNYIKIEMPRDFRKLKFEGIDYAKILKVR